MSAYIEERRCKVNVKIVRSMVSVSAECISPADRLKSNTDHTTRIYPISLRAGVKLNAVVLCVAVT